MIIKVLSIDDAKQQLDLAGDGRTERRERKGDLAAAKKDRVMWMGIAIVLYGFFTFLLYEWVT